MTAHPPALDLPTRRTIVVTIPGPAKGKQRARVVRRGAFASSFTPKETVNAESWVRHCCIEQAGQPCLEGPLLLSVEIVCQVAESWSKKKQAAALAGTIMPTGKPDLDNCFKLLADALNGVMWKDDAQIVSLSVQKRYGRAPGTTLRVTVL